VTIKKNLELKKLLASGYGEFSLPVIFKIYVIIYLEHLFIELTISKIWELFLIPN